MTDEKVVTKSEYGKTKRRKYSTPFGPYSFANSMSAISARVTRLSRSLHQKAPPHLWSIDLNSTGNFSTTGAIYDLCTNIIQGDATTQRFGNKISCLRANLRGTVVPGSTQAGPITCRLALIKGPANLGAGRMDNTTISPTGNTSVNRVFYDKVFQCGSSPTANGYPTQFNLSIKLRNLPIKFNGSGTGTVSGESLFWIWSSNTATGTGAPIWGSGIFELYFTP